MLIFLGAILVIIYYLFIKKKESNAPSEDITKKLQEGLSEIKEQLQEASYKAVVEVAIAKKKHENVKQELKDVAKIKDNKERRTRLASLATRDDVNYD